MILMSLMFIQANACNGSSSSKEARNVNRQQSQYAKGQPVPAFNWSLERHLLSQLYNIRNQKVATHAVWRSDYGSIEGDCPSMGFGIPYDTSLTNPLKSYGGGSSRTTIEQAEPNGIFASKNTAATWVMCLGKGGRIEPVYVETKVTIYPGPVIVNYAKNRVRRSGAATVMINRTKAE